MKLSKYKVVHKTYYTKEPIRSKVAYKILIL